MGEDGPEWNAGISLTPCISQREEIAKIVAAVMTAGNSPELEPYQNNSISYLNTLISKKKHLSLFYRT
jgi:hypothetical protein